MTDFKFSDFSFDKPHGQWGEHVDIVTPLSNDGMGAQKIRVGPAGEFLSDDLQLSSRWDPDPEPEIEPMNPGEGLAILFEE